MHMLAIIDNLLNVYIITSLQNRTLSVNGVVSNTPLYLIYM
jgi:hypothetical protein